MDKGGRGARMAEVLERERAESERGSGGDSRLREQCAVVLTRHRRGPPTAESVRRLTRLVEWELGSAGESETPERAVIRSAVTRCSWRLEWIEDWPARRAAVLRSKALAFGRPQSLLYGEPALQMEWKAWFDALPQSLEDDCSFATACGLLREFERSIAPSTLYFLRGSPAALTERWSAFISLAPFDDDECRRLLHRALERGGGPSDPERLIQAIGVAHLRSFATPSLHAMSGWFHQWGDVVRYYQDPGYRDRCPPEVVAEARELYGDLLDQVSRAWRSEMRALDVEDAVQETVCRLVEDAFRTYRYESDLLHYLVEVGKDVMRRHYRRMRPQELGADEPVLDVRPRPRSLSQALDRSQRIRAQLRPLIESKFKRPNWELAELIFEEVLAEAEAELTAETCPDGRVHRLPLSDEELAREICQRTGRKTSVPYLRVIRCRIRAALADLFGIAGD